MFILFPLGHDEDSVRRLPWVTITILLICVVVQIFNTGAPVDALIGIEEAADEVRDFWVEHPYLELHPELRQDAERWLIEDQWRAEGQREIEEPSVEQRREEQRQLDGLIDDWIAARDRITTARYGLIPAHIEIGDLFAYMFLHAGWMHLVGNLIFLWLTAPPLEDVWGRSYFALFYLATGVFGGLAWAALYPNSLTPLVGASGAVAGMMGAFMVRYGKTQVKMFYLFFWIFPTILRTGTFTAPAATMLGLWFARELFSAVVVGQHTGVAFAVHVAGFLFGAGGAWLLRKIRHEHKVAAKIDVKLGGIDLSKPAIEDAHELRQKGQPEKALQILTEEAQRRPGDLETSLALWDVSVELGRQREAAPMFLRSIRSELRSGEHEMGLSHWYELAEQVPDVRPDLELRIRLAEAMLGSQRDEDAADLLAEADQMLPPSASLGVQMRLAKLAARSRSASAPALCERLLHDPTVPEPYRQQIAQEYSAVAAFGLRPKPVPPVPPQPVPPQPVPPQPVLPQPAYPQPVPPQAAAPPPQATPAPPQGWTPAPEPPAEPPAPPVDENAPLPLSDDTNSNRVLKPMLSVPRRLTGDKLAVDVQRQGAKTLPLSRVEAVAVGRIEEGAGGGYVIIDLLVDSLWGDRRAIRTVRFQSTDFDPTEVLPVLVGQDPLQALIGFLDNLIVTSGANPMPDAEAARGRPFHSFVSIPEYEAKVIGFTTG